MKNKPIIKNIKVTPGNSPGAYQVEKSEIQEYLNSLKQESVHCLTAVGSFATFLSSEWSKAEVVEGVSKSDQTALITGKGLSDTTRHHALLIISDGEVRLFNIGKITNDMLDIQEAQND